MERRKNDKISKIDLFFKFVLVLNFLQGRMQVRFILFGITPNITLSLKVTITPKLNPITRLYSFQIRLTVGKFMVDVKPLFTSKSFSIS